MTNSLYSKETFMSLLSSTKSCCGRVDLILPPVSGEGYPDVISGFLEEDFTLSLGNTWGSVLPDAENANQIGQMLGSQNQITWIQSSAASWKATQPLEFDITVYLITLIENQDPIIEEAKKVMKMMALHVEDNDFFTAKIHGGYSVDYAMSNLDLSLWTSKEALKNATTNATELTSQASKAFKALSGEAVNGTITLRLNDTMKINNLLLSKASITHSAAYIDAKTPLYIKMDLSFRSYRALLTKDIDDLYGS